MKMKEKILENEISTRGTEYFANENYWYRAPSQNPLEDIAAFCLAAIIPFLIWGGKARIESRHAQNNYRPTEQRQIYDINSNLGQNIYVLKGEEM
jgi:hypothetical protein